MAKKIQAWVAYGPRIELTKPMTEEELTENVVAATNQSKGSLMASLAEMDVQIESALKAGRIVHLPNGMHLEPVGKKDGTVEIHVRVSPDLVKRVNDNFRGTWRNAQNIDKTEAEIIALWDADNPTDLIEQ